MAFHGLDPRKFKDGAEIYLKVLIVTIFSVTITAGPIAAGLVHFQVHFYGLFKTEYFLVTGLTGLCLALVHFVDCLHVYFHVSSVVIFVNASTTFLGKIM